MDRLGWSSRLADVLHPVVMLPQAGQGALAVQCRAADDEARRLLAPLDDPPTHRALRAERAVLAALGGSCTAPVAAWAESLAAPAGALRVHGLVASGDGRTVVKVERDRDEPEAVGAAVARAALVDAAARPSTASTASRDRLPGRRGAGRPRAAHPARRLAAGPGRRRSARPSGFEGRAEPGASASARGGRGQGAGRGRAGPPGARSRDCWSSTAGTPTWSSGSRVGILSSSAGAGRRWRSCAGGHRLGGRARGHVRLRGARRGRHPRDPARVGLLGHRGHRSCRRHRGARRRRLARAGPGRRHPGHPHGGGDAGRDRRGARHGWTDPATPVAVIERGTGPAERVVRTTLDQLGSVQVEAPAVIVVGPVAALGSSPSAIGGSRSGGGTAGGAHGGGHPVRPAGRAPRRDARARRRRGRPAPAHPAGRRRRRRCRAARRGRGRISRTTTPGSS